MKGRFFRNAIEDKPAIYKIVNIKNRHKYIGQSINPIQRRETHYRNLTKGRHANPYLQSAFNLYGAASFEFVILEYVNHCDLTVREQFWIDCTKPEYNAILKVDEPYFKDKRAYDTIYVRGEDTFQRPDWHAWVYGSAKNPLLRSRESE